MNKIGHLIGLSGIVKAQFSHHIEAIMIPFRDHDETEYKNLSFCRKHINVSAYLPRIPMELVYNCQEL